MKKNISLEPDAELDTDENVTTNAVEYLKQNTFLDRKGNLTIEMKNCYIYIFILPSSSSLYPNIRRRKYRTAILGL